MDKIKVEPSSIYKKENLLDILAFGISDIIGPIENVDETELEKLSEWQKLAYFHFFFDFKIDSYGFLLLFNINCGKYFPQLNELLKLIKGEQSAPIYAEAYSIYLQNKEKIYGTIGKDPIIILVLLVFV